MVEALRKRALREEGLAESNESIRIGRAAMSSESTYGGDPGYRKVSPASSRRSSPAPSSVANSWKPSIKSRDPSPAPRHSSGGCFSTGTLIPVEPSLPLSPTRRTRVAVELLREGDRISTRYILGTHHLGGNALAVPSWTSIHSIWKTSCPLLRRCFPVEGGYVTTDHPLF